MKKLKQLIVEYLSILLYAFGIAFMFWAYKPEGSVSNKIFFMALIPLIIFAAESIKWIILNLDKNNLSEIIVIDEDSVLLHPSDLYSEGTIVSFYYKEGEFERYMGYGYVETIQHPSRRVQNNMLNKFQNINKDKILIKPFANKNIIDALKGDNNE